MPRKPLLFRSSQRPFRRALLQHGAANARQDLAGFTALAANVPTTVLVGAGARRPDRARTPQRGDAHRRGGHATVLIQARGLNLITDPFWSERTSPVPFLGPRRVCAPAIAFTDLPPIDAILLSHNHYDHLARYGHAWPAGGARRPAIVTPLGNDAIVRRAIPAARIVTGDGWDSHLLADDVQITLVPAQHWSTRSLFDPWPCGAASPFVRAATSSILPATQAMAMARCSWRAVQGDPPTHRSAPLVHGGPTHRSRRSRDDFQGSGGAPCDWRSLGRHSPE